LREEEKESVIRQRDVVTKGKEGEQPMTQIGVDEVSMEMML